MCFSGSCSLEERCEDKEEEEMEKTVQLDVSTLEDRAVHYSYTSGSMPGAL